MDIKIITNEELAKVTTLCKVDFYSFMFSLGIYKYDATDYRVYNFYTNITDIVASSNRESEADMQKLMILMMEKCNANAHLISEFEKRTYNKDKFSNYLTSSLGLSATLDDIYSDFIKNLIYILPLSDAETLELKDKLLEMYINPEIRYLISNPNLWLKHKIVGILYKLADIYDIFKIIVIPNDTVSLFTKTLFTGKVSMSKHLYNLVKIEKSFLSDYNKYSEHPQVVNALFYDLNQTREYKIAKSKFLLIGK